MRHGLTLRRSVPSAPTALRCSGRGRAVHLSPRSLRSRCEHRQRVWGRSTRLRRAPTPALRAFVAAQW